MIDFASLASRLLQQARSLLPTWFPAGRLHGNEFKVGDLAGSEGESLSINVVTGQWSDFSTGDKGGDLISLYAAMHGIKQSEAVKQLDDGTIATRVPPAPPAKPERGEWTPIMPVPADAPTPPDDFYRKMAGDWTKLVTRQRWGYVDATGALLGYVCRFEWFNAKEELCKDVIPQVYCQHEDGRKQWRWRAFESPRPLYNLKELHDRPDAPVMIVEGEKKVEAIRKLAPQYVGIAWQGGARAWRKSDWSPLRGRKVLLWPDADQKTVKTAQESLRYKTPIGEQIPRDLQPGILAMWEIGHHVLPKSPEVKIILPVGKPDGWDAADALADGMDWAALKRWALPLVQQLTGATDGKPKHSRGSSGVSSQDAAAEKVPQRDLHGAAVGAHADQRIEWQDDERDEHGADRQATDAAGTDQRAAPGHRGAAGGDRADAPGTAGREGRDGEGGTLPRSDARSAIEVGWRSQTDRDRGLRTAADPATPAPAEAQSQVNRWLAWNLDRNGNGLPYTNLNNAVSVLESDPKLAGLVWFDEFLQRILTGEPAREWSDADDINLTLYMQREVGLTKIGLDIVRNAVVIAAQRDRRNVVRDWMNSLTWDQVPRIDQFFIDVFGAEDNEYTRAAGRNFWTSIVARVFTPGCKVDNMIILEGAQGLGKSMALAIIGGDWFAEQHESATNPKAFAEVLLGKLVIEISEMDAFSRAEVNTIKKVVSCQSDRFRLAYGRHASDHPRQCVMIGTTNKDDWNRDETGARRFWPIRCDGLVRLDLLRENRNALFSEAVAAFKAGATWWEMPDASTQAEQAARYDADPWLEAIAAYVAMLRETTTNEVLSGCLRYNLREITRLEQMRVASCLRRLGWSKGGNVRRNGDQVRIWNPPRNQAQVAAGEAAEMQRTEQSPFQ